MLRFGLLGLFLLVACGTDDAPTCGEIASTPDLSGDWSTLGCGAPETCQLAQTDGDVTLVCPSGSSCTGSLCVNRTLVLDCSGADGEQYVGRLSLSEDDSTLSGEFEGSDTCAVIFERQ